MKWQGRDDDDMLVLYKTGSSSRRWVVVLCWGFLVCSAGEGMERVNPFNTKTQQQTLAK